MLHKPHILLVLTQRRIQEDHVTLLQPESALATADLSLSRDGLSGLAVAIMDVIYP
jgi:hypothetical protein